MRFILFAIALIGAQPTSTEPEWSHILGNVTCPNADKVYHYVPNRGCATTVCYFPDNVMYIFEICDTFDPKCTAYGADQCVEETVVF